MPPAKPAVFVVFDLETTGLEPKKERIVEIGAVKFDSRGPIGRFSVLVDPGMPMPAEASKINGITDAMLSGKPSLDEVFPDFLRFIEGTILVAHNAPFDCSFVDAALASRWERNRKAAPEDAAQGSLLGGENLDEGSAPRKSWAPPFPALPNKVVDTRIFAKEAFPGRWKYSLQELAKYLGINALEAHRAEDDARVCMEVFVKCAEKCAGKDVAVFSA
jgi:DNA polymerase-3 subunit epsilon